MKFADPKNDVAFKKIFGNENKKEILISFLNNILDFTGTNKEIVEITIANPYQVPKLDGLKHSILDIKALINGESLISSKCRSSIPKLSKKKCCIIPVKPMSNSLIKRRSIRN